VANCAVCKEDIQRGSVCPRCGSDNKGVSDNTFGYFASIWAILSFLLILAPLFMLLPMVLSRVDGIFQPIASVRVGAPIALLLTLVIAFFLFSMRDDLHEQSQSRTFRAKQGTPLPIQALQFFIVAVALTFLLGFAVASKKLLIGSGDGQIPLDSGGHLFLMFVMTACLILVFAFFSLATGFMAVYEFGIYAEERTPDPIYLNERLMLRVVLSAVQQQIGGEAGIPIDQLDQPIDAPDDNKVELFLREMKRTSNAGMTLQLYEKGKLQVVGKDDQQKTLLQEKGWWVEADLWARVRKVEERGDRTIKLPKPEKKEEESKALMPSGL
jgi:hypothetical protein